MPTEDVYSSWYMVLSHSNLQKSKRFDLIDKFNDTSRYLDDIFTIDNPAFAEHILDIYPRELQVNKANTSDTETSFLDLNIAIFTWAFTTNAMTLDFLDSHHTVFTFRS